MKISNSSSSEPLPSQQSQNPVNNDGVSDHMNISCSSSSGPAPNKESQIPVSNDGVPAMETAPPDVHNTYPTALTGSGGDYEAIKSFADAKKICILETRKLWVIAGPIIFNMLCNYGINSFTNIFVGHIGNVELSAIAISLSVIGNLSFGFLVCNSSNPLIIDFLSKLLLFHIIKHYWYHFVTRFSILSDFY